MVGSFRIAIMGAALLVHDAVAARQCHLTQEEERMEIPQTILDHLSQEEGDGISHTISGRGSLESLRLDNMSQDSSPEEHVLDISRAAPKNGSLDLFRIGVGKDTFYDVGFDHGKQAAHRIQKFLATCFIKELIAFRERNGRAFFDQLVSYNTAAFPDYAEEIRGIAAGAKVHLDDIWMLNLQGEITGALVYEMPANASSMCHCTARGVDVDPDCSMKVPEATRAVESALQKDCISKVHDREHCSTLVSFFEREGLVLGHTEDWDPEFVPILYLQDVVYPGGTHLVGFGYPGQILGFAIVSNSHGLFFTQNSVWPKEVRVGPGLTFVSRRAMDHDTLEGAIAALQDSPLAWGVSVNIISLSTRQGANVEVSHGPPNGLSNVEMIEKPGQSLVHLNQFRRLPDHNGRVTPSSKARTARQAFLGPPGSVDELKERLCYQGSDTAEKLDAIYRPSTMMTWLVSAESVLVWHGAPCNSDPSIIDRPE